ncbi:MAG: cupin domain-containing protein, partial [Halobacteria archaeon]|nr:cupin domain-containing protein [Halobacteria archaeon]
YEVVHTEDVPRVDLDEALDGMFDPDVRRVETQLGTEKMAPSLWYFDEGEEMIHHAHSEQEELYYVLEGEFEVKFGEAGDTETYNVGAGTFFAAGPDVEHGHKCVSERGIVLAIGSPNVTDINPDTYTPFDEA